MATRSPSRAWKKSSRPSRLSSLLKNRLSAMKHYRKDAGGLTLADQQRDDFFGVLRERFPDLVESLRTASIPREATGRAGLAVAGDGPAHPGAMSRGGHRRPDAAADHPRGKAGAEQAGRRNIGEPGVRAGIGRGAGAARSGLTARPPGRWRIRSRTSAWCTGRWDCAGCRASGMWGRRWRERSNGC